MEILKKTLSLSKEQGEILVRLARLVLFQELGDRSGQQEEMTLEASLREDCFKEPRGTFVSLKLDGQLRGCIGNLSDDIPMGKGVRQNALGAAFRDARFQPLTLAELTRVRIEVSVLTPPIALCHANAADLIASLRPGLDGVIIRDGPASATFLPQVWEQLPQPEIFLGHLCQKAGLQPDAWQHTPLEVMTYQVQYFTEG
jgi:AmmeMemoRadiSam system protein A